MDAKDAYTTIIECLPELDDSHLKKVRHILNTIYGKESTPSLEESNEEAADLIHFYKVFRTHLRQSSGIVLPERLFISQDTLKRWVETREFVSALQIKSPSERVAIYRIFSRIYLHWIIESKAPMTKHIFLANLNRIPTLVNQQLPALANPFVRATLLHKEGVHYV